jgi:hypothetical protein
VSLYDKIVQAVRLAWNIRSEDDLQFSDLIEDETLSGEELARLWLTVDEYRKTVNLVAQVVGDKWVEYWKACGSLEVDGFLVGAKKGYTKESCVDSEGFWSWVYKQEDPELARRLFNENQARTGRLPAAVRDTFYEKTQVVKPDATEVPMAIPTEVLNDR